MHKLRKMHVELMKKHFPQSIAERIILITNKIVVYYICCCCCRSITVFWLYRSVYIYTYLYMSIHTFNNFDST